MNDIKIQMPGHPGLEAIVFEKLRDIYGRKYDAIIVCRLPLEETERLRSIINAEKIRQEATYRRVRIRELQEKLERLTAAEVPEPGR